MWNKFKGFAMSLKLAIGLIAFVWGLFFLLIPPVATIVTLFILVFAAMVRIVTAHIEGEFKK